MSFFHQSIKILNLPLVHEMAQDSSYVTYAYTILPFCKNVRRLTFWVGYIEFYPHLAGLLGDMRPRWASAYFDNLLNPGSPDFSLPFFSQVTHLRIMDREWTFWANFHLLARLTHLHVYLPRTASSDASVKEMATSAVKNILTKCLQLRVCVLAMRHYDVYLENINDLRVVYTIEILDGRRRELDLEGDIGGGPDTFAYAEKEVEIQKKNGCRSPARYVPSLKP